MAKDEKPKGTIFTAARGFEMPEDQQGPDLESDPTIQAGKARVPLVGSVPGAATGRMSGVLSTEPGSRDDVEIGEGPLEMGSPLTKDEKAERRSKAAKK